MNQQEEKIKQWLERQIDAKKDYLEIGEFCYGSKYEETVHVYDLKSYMHLAEILDVQPCFEKFIDDDETKYENHGFYQFIYRDMKIVCAVKQIDIKRYENYKKGIKSNEEIHSA